MNLPWGQRTKIHIFDQLQIHTEQIECHDEALDDLQQPLQPICVLPDYEQIQDEVYVNQQLCVVLYDSSQHMEESRDMVCNLWHHLWTRYEQSPKQSQMQRYYYLL